MIKDVLLPEQIAGYYIFGKKVASIQCVGQSVYGTLFYLQGRIKKLLSVVKVDVHEASPAMYVKGIKQVIAKLGSYTSVVTSLGSTPLVLKELELPFVGREKIAMMIEYEVEQYLPFSREDAVIDFVVMHEDRQAGTSKVLVAAARMHDVTMHKDMFAQAGVALDMLTVDLFSWYDVYTHAMTKKNKDRKILCIDVADQQSRLLYFDKGSLAQYRVIPYGHYIALQQSAQACEIELHHLVDITHEQSSLSVEEKEKAQKCVDQADEKLAQELAKAVMLFAHQDTDFYPAKIYVSGVELSLVNQLKLLVSYPIERYSIAKVLKHIGIVHDQGIDLFMYASSVIPFLSAYIFGDVNMLHKHEAAVDDSLFKKQVGVAVLLICGAFGSVWWYSSSQLQSMARQYRKAKHQITSTLQNHMGVDFSHIKNVKELVNQAQDTLEKERKLWFSFSSQSQNSFLQQLQDLFTRIDKKTLGLQVRKMTMNHQEVTIQAQVKGYEVLDVLEEELAASSLFTLVEKPRELNFTIVLKVKSQKKEGV